MLTWKHFMLEENESHVRISTTILTSLSSEECLFCLKEPQFMPSLSITLFHLSDRGKVPWYSTSLISPKRHSTSFPILHLVFHTFRFHLLQFNSFFFSLSFRNFVELTMIVIVILSYWFSICKQKKSNRKWIEAVWRSIYTCWTITLSRKLISAVHVPGKYEQKY